MTFKDLLRKHQHLGWSLFTNTRDDNTVSCVGTCPGTHDGTLTILSGMLPNNFDEATTEWLHVLSFEGSAILGLTTGGYVHLLPDTAVAVPARLFAWLSSPAWYGYLVVLPL